MKKWKELNEQERRAFTTKFYDLWHVKIGYANTEIRGSLWGCPWEWDADGDVTTPEFWMSFCFEGIMRGYDKLLESHANQQRYLSRCRQKAKTHEDGISIGSDGTIFRISKIRRVRISDVHRVKPGERIDD